MTYRQRGKPMTHGTDSTKLPNLGWIARMFVSVALLVLAGAPAFGQGGLASINGTVTDQTGAVVAGAKVVATHAATGQSRDTTSADNGTYVIPLLPVGVYTVACSHAGFKTSTHADTTLEADQRATVDFSLAVGEVTQMVEVSAAAERLNTQNGAIGQIVSERNIVELPLNGRNPAELVFLAPGSQDGLKTGVFNSQNFTTFPAETGASVNGGRQGSTFYMLDGANSMDNYENLASPFPNADATKEFQVLTNNFDAQYGFSPGAVVSIVTKSGSNTWHGDAFEFLRNTSLNARDFFEHTRDTLNRNQFGGSAGGKIIRDKLFIFGNYQGTVEHLTINSTTAFVPNNKMLTGDFSDQLTGKTSNACGAGGPANLNFDTGQIFNPQTASNFTCPAGSAMAGQQVVVKQPYANNFINPSNFSPISLKFENETLPTTTDPTGYVVIPGRIANQKYNEFTIKPDWYISPKSHLSGRVFWDKFSHPLESGGGDILLSDRSWDSTFSNYGGNWVYSIHPTLINNLVVYYNRTTANSVPGLRTKSNGPVCYPCFGVNVSDYPTTPPGIDLLATDDWNNGFSVAQNTNIINRYNVSIADTVTWTRGKHLVVAGVNVLDQHWDESTDWLALPLMTFGTQFTNSQFSDWLLGNADSFEQGAGEFNQVHGVSWAFFGQDTIRLKPNLTLNVGLRWEPFIPYTPSLGRIGLYRPGVQSTRYPNAPLDLAYPGDPGVPAGSGIPNELGVFSPRLAVAWQPKGLSNTNIRAAFGIFAAPFEMSFYNHAADTAPFSPTFSYGPTNTGGPVVPGGTVIPFANPWSVYAPSAGQSLFPPFASSGYVPPSSTTFILPVFIQDSFNGDFKIGREQSWNFSIERQFKGDILLRAAYVGSEAYHLPNPQEQNPSHAPLTHNPADIGNRANANFQSILENVSWTTASYNGLQLTFDKRFSHGVQFTSNYTWSKTLDENSAASLAFNSPVPDPFDLRFNRGKSSLNFTHIWTSYGVYDLPTLNNANRFVRGVLGGWELTGIWRLQSGLPFSIQGGTNASCGCSNNNASESLVGQDRADVTGQPFNVKQGSKAQWINQYFNVAAFRPNAQYTFGNSPRNQLVGPHLNNADIGINKNFPFHERYRIQFRWEMFNAFNTPAFNPPGTSPTGSGFGQITSSWGTANGTFQASTFGYPARVMQAALKFYW
jgi:hypothetical protein